MSDPNDTMRLAITGNRKSALSMFGGDAPLIDRMFPKSKPEDLVLLFRMSELLRLNPITKEIYILETGSGSQIYIGKAGLSRKLNENGGFSCSYSQGLDDIAASMLKPRGNTAMSGKGLYIDCTIHHLGNKVTARAYWDEYAPEVLKPGSSWLKYPFSMLEKVAFCKAARHCLGINIPAAEEMGQEIDNEGDGGVVTGLGKIEAEVVEMVTIWNGKEYPANDAIGQAAVSKKQFKELFVDKFPNNDAFVERLKGKFDLTDPAQMTWRQLNDWHNELYNTNPAPTAQAEKKSSVSGWDAVRNLESRFVDAGFGETFKLIIGRLDVKLGSMDGDKTESTMRDVLEALTTGVYGNPPSDDELKEIVEVLSKI